MAEGVSHRFIYPSLRLKVLDELLESHVGLELIRRHTVAAGNELSLSICAMLINS